MANQEQIKANINSLMSLNNGLIAKLKESSVKIQTKDFDTEIYINSATTNKQGIAVIEPKSNVSLKVVNSTMDDIDTIYKKIQENCIAIKELSKRLNPYVPDEDEIHAYNVKGALDKRIIKAGQIELIEDDDDMFQIISNCLKLALSYVIIKISKDINFFTNLMKFEEMAEKFTYRGIHAIPLLVITSEEGLRDYGDAVSAVTSIAEAHKLRAVLIENSINSDLLSVNEFQAAALIKHLKAKFVNPLGCVLVNSTEKPIDSQIDIDIVSKEFDIIAFKNADPANLQIDTDLFPDSKVFFVCNYLDFTDYESMHTMYSTDNNMIGFCIGSVEEDNETNTLNPVGSEYASSIANLKFER